MSVIRRRDRYRIDVLSLQQFAEVRIRINRLAVLIPEVGDLRTENLLVNVAQRHNVFADYVDVLQSSGSEADLRHTDIFDISCREGATGNSDCRYSAGCRVDELSSVNCHSKGS
jgi:hypothetical protein